MIPEPKYYVCSGCDDVTTEERISKIKYKPENCRHCGSVMRAMTEREVENMKEEYEFKQNIQSLESLANGY